MPASLLPIASAPTDGWANRAPVWPVAPLAPALGALALGVVVDRFAWPFETTTWSAALLALTVVSALSIRRAWVSTLCLLGAIVAAGGGYHHHRWFDLAPDDLARGIDETPRPAWLRGIVEEIIGERLREGRSMADEPRVETRFRLRTTGVSNGRTFQHAAGRVDVTVLGALPDLTPGDPVQVAGRLSKVAAPLNPGEFDYRAHLRARGVRLKMTVDEPAGVMADDARPPWGAGWLGKLRRWSRARLVEGLDDRIAPLAAALVLGQRDELDPELGDAFIRTGTTHLLAVSGLHLQAVALAIGGALLLIGVPRRPRYGLVAMATFGYAVLVGFSPSVSRSMVMTLSFCAAALANREPRPANTLALAGILTIAINPAFVFDVGCQLSFLAVASLFWLLPPAHEHANRIYGRLREQIFGPPNPLDELEPWNQSLIRQAIRGVGRFAVEGILVSAIVWAAATPLVALRFHLFSPIGILMNIPMVPLMSLALMLGALQLAVAAVGLPFAGALGMVVGWLLNFSEAIVRWGADQPRGYLFTPGPTWAPTLIFYVLLLVAIFVMNAGRRPDPGASLRRARRFAWLAVLAWLAPLWISVGRGGPPKTLEGEVLAVGHGQALILRTPEGATFLYDCGRMDDPGVGRRIIAPALWSRGVSRIDAVFLSHADQDHYNGLPDLMERFDIGEVVTPENFDDQANPDAGRLLDLLRTRGTPVRELHAPASWMSGSTRFHALHPPEGWRFDASDNARSLVLEVEHLGRRMLLTGDLDGPGLVELASHPKPAPPIDLMLSPHHGGRTANPLWLYSWANPRAVIVSQKPPVPGLRDALTAVEERSTLLRTWKSGAIRLRWTPEEIIMRGFLEENEEGQAE